MHPDSNASERKTIGSDLIDDHCVYAIRLQQIPYQKFLIIPLAPQ